MSLRERLAERGIELGDEAGRGAMAVVYRAVDRRHARPVAVKVFRPGADVELGQDRFLREIRLAAGLQHPHILPVYDSGVADGAPFYVMPYVEGESLRQRLARTGRLPFDEAIRIAREVADALGYAHAHGVVHRDIKPENILLEGRHAVVADFGVALAIGRNSGEDGRLTGVGMVLGSPEYMSPEQASADAAVDGRSDIFSLGCVLYEMLAGEPPFLGSSLREMVARRFQGPPTPLHERRPEIPTAVSAAVQKALAVDPAARFERVEDFAAALRRPENRGWIAGRGVAVVAGGLALAAITLLAGRAVPGETPRLDPRRVAVAALSNETGDSRLAPLGPLVAAWITERLGRAGTVEVVTSAIVLPAQHDEHTTPNAADGPEQLHTLAAETRAGTLVTGSYYRGDTGAVEFHIEITDANSGDLLRAIGPIYSRGSSERLAAELSRAVAGAIDTVIALRDGEAGVGGAWRASLGPSFSLTLDLSLATLIAHFSLASSHAARLCRAAPVYPLRMAQLRSYSVATTLLLLPIVTACVGAARTTAQASPRPASRYPSTEADARFMSAMIGHHAQAMAMAGWAPTHGASASVRRLAERIMSGQQDEIATMQQWLRDRGRRVPQSHDPGHGHLMPGMLTEAQMRELAEARGPEFDRLFLAFMIQHHRGAVAMVKELFGTPGAAQDETVFKFANDVNVDQSTEIARMERMLSALPAGEPSS